MTDRYKYFETIATSILYCRSSQIRIKKKKHQDVIKIQVNKVITYSRYNMWYLLVYSAK